MSYPRTNILFLFLASLVLVSCGLGSAKRARVGGGGIGAIAFQATVYPILENKCAGCHASSQTPFIANSNPEKAYGIAKDYADFSVPTLATLSKRASDGHCGSACTGGKDEMAKAIEAWWVEGESRFVDPDALGKITTEQSLSGIGEQNYTQLSWDLGQFGIEYQNVIFSLEIRQFDSETYEIINLSMDANGKEVSVKGVRILLNEAFDPQNTAFVSINKFVMGTAPTSLGSTSMIANAVNGAAGDKISIAFETLRIGGCRNLALFQQTVKPILQACASCHGGNRPSGGFNLTGEDAVVCVDALERTSVTDPAVSSLIRYPLLGTPMRTSPQINQSQADIILNWINSELAP